MTGATRPDIPAAPAPSETATGPAGRVQEDAAKARTLLSGALLDELSRRVLDYENAITWDTSCTSCARILDSAAEQTFRAEAAEAKLAEIEAHAPAIVDALRHALSYVEHVPVPSSQAAAGRYRSALAVIGTGEKQERSDEKGPRP